MGAANRPTRAIRYTGRNAALRKFRLKGATVMWVSLPRAARFGLALFLVVLLLGLLAWAAAAPAIAFIVERELRGAGWPEASVTGVSLAWGGVRVARVALAAEEDVFLE